MIRRAPSVAFAAIAMAAFTTTAALAQAEIAKQAIAKADQAWSKAQEACSPDVKAYCSSVTPGDGRMIFCMMAHEDKISDRCFNTLLDIADNLDLAVSNIARAADVCDEDIENVCGKVDPGEGRIAQCLIDNQAKVSSACRAEVAGFQARMKK